ncbi:hypothetical protein AZE42_10864 [Rhizopogon vesiculosus]|uniref:Uncharacterized protein n=1 Tax=Rhizopogon vesiculosus TaxID=180088 RepID=A0A1J8R0Q4_9AGAM|nr:hypothetical protein AZE42_10864 [Rhizopogon vesiculosus]
MIKTPKSLNTYTGNVTWTANAFSVNNWDSQTASFAKSARSKGNNVLKDITSTAWKLLKKPKSGLEDCLSDDLSDDLDERAFV